MDFLLTFHCVILTSDGKTVPEKGNQLIKY